MVGRGNSRGRARREEILDRAVEVFGETGYRSASLREIAGRCGITHPGLLHHFATKEALLLAVLERRDAIDAAEAQAAGARGLGELRRIVEGVATTASQRAIVELFVTLSAEAVSADHPAHGYFSARYSAVITHIGDAFGEAAEQGALRRGVDPSRAARELVALLDGLQVLWLFDPDGTDMARIVEDHVASRITPRGLADPAWVGQSAQG